LGSRCGYFSLARVRRLGPGAQHLFDLIYFSAVTFTTALFGDLVPVGPIRFLAGTEALTGFRP